MEPSDIESVVARLIASNELQMYKDLLAIDEMMAKIARDTFDKRMRELLFCAIYTTTNAVTVADIPEAVWKREKHTEQTIGSMVWAVRYNAALTGKNMRGFIKLCGILGGLLLDTLDESRESLRGEPEEKVFLFTVKLALESYERAVEIMGTKLKKYARKYATVTNAAGENDFPLLTDVKSPKL